MEDFGVMGFGGFHREVTGEVELERRALEEAPGALELFKLVVKNFLVADKIAELGAEIAFRFA